ncbi:MAG TPA: hypothetical protein PKA63_09540 [Oligoflexia bacterium]|nr:hypothetical protein [Oligoflexia bacterium]HMP48896.1 hypothetical protein [Oligoflexia bacterium]
MQEIQIITDSSYFDTNLINSKVTAVGASIIRFKKTNDQIFSSTFYSRKYIFLLEAENSTQAELLTGIQALKTISKDYNFLTFSEIKDTNSKKILNPPIIRWFCDVPYLPALIKQSSDNVDDPEHSLINTINIIKSLSEGFSLKIFTPDTSNEKKYHYLCHRACRMLRPVILKSSDSDFDSVLFKKNMSKEVEIFLKHKKSDWELITAEP